MTEIGSPIAVATALLVYFGWVRTDIQAQELGYDASVMDLSVQDYIIRSVNVLYVPLIVTVLAAVALHRLHTHVIAPARPDGRRPTREERSRLTQWVRILTFSWVLWVPVYVLLFLAGPPLRGFALPGLLTATLLCGVYAGVLRRRLHDERSRPPVARALAIVLLTLVVFWDTERVARMMGEAYAADIVAAPEKLPAVTLYSIDDLAIDAPGVTADRAGPQYRYQGLRLLHRSGSRYLLVAQSRNPTLTRVLVIAETPTLRIEFSR